MKTRKITPTYAVLSLGQIRQIAKFAEGSAVDMYGYSEPKHCIILNGLSVKVEGKLQFSAEKICGGGREIGFSWE